MYVKVLDEQKTAPLMWGKPTAIRPLVFIDSYFPEGDLALFIGAPSTEELCLDHPVLDENSCSTWLFFSPCDITRCAFDFSQTEISDLPWLNSQNMAKSTIYQALT